MDTNFVFDVNDNFKDQFRKYVKVLNTKAKYPVEDKMMIANCLIESYVSFTGERPEPFLLDLLSSWLLRYENVNGDFKSERQLRRIKQEKETLSDFVENDDRHIRRDGHKITGIKPTMDSDDSHKIKVRLPNDNTDRRQFNGPLRKYFIDFID